MKILIFKRLKEFKESLKNMISAEIVVRVVKNEKQTKGLPKQLCNNQ